MKKKKEKRIIQSAGDAYLYKKIHPTVILITIKIIIIPTAINSENDLIF